VLFATTFLTNTAATGTWKEVQVKNDSQLCVKKKRERKRRKIAQGLVEIP